MAQKFEPQQFFTVIGLSASVGPTVLPLGPRGLYAVAPWSSFDWNFVFESEDLEVAYGGARMQLFFDDWYFRIHFLPATLAFGTFSSQTVRSVNAWNAYPLEQNLSGVSLVDSEDSGIYYTAPETPYTFGPFEVRPVTFTALQRGQDAISEIATFSFDTIGDRDLIITGFRLPPPESFLWPFKHNWSRAWAVEREWRTDIITSRDGTEQRRAVRSYPRRRHALSSVVKPSQLRDFRKLIARRTKNTFVLPDYTTRTQLTAPANNSVTAFVASAPFWFDVDKYVVFEHGEQRLQRLIRSVSGTEITFWEADGLTWPEGTRVYPGLVCELADENRVNMLTSEVGTIPVTFEVVPGSEPIEPFGAPTEVFDGREVRSFRHNWNSNQDTAFLRPSELVDFGYGVRSRFFPQKLPKHRMQVQMTLRSEELAADLRKFVGRMRGRQGEFYFTPGENDLTAQLDLLPNVDTQYLRTPGSEDFLAYREDPSKRAIEVELTDGTILRRVIESIEFVDDMLGASTQFNLRGQWPTTILVEQIRRISFMALYRLSSDVYEERWDTNGVCRVQLQIETITKEEADEL